MRAMAGIWHGAARWAWLMALPVAALAAAQDDIRDIRGPKAVAAGSWPLSAVSAATAVAALCVYLLWRRYHATVRPRKLTLAEQALEDLEKARLLMVPATAREFGIAASEVMRHYIERRFAVLATQRTTEEFLQSLLHASDETLARHRPLLDQFLHQCDFIKFAGASLSVADMEPVLQSARGFVQETSVVPAS